MSSTQATVRLWRVQRYPTWFVSDASKELAASLLDFAVPLIALMVTDSPAQAGVIGAVGVITALILTLVGGVLADRHRRTGLMLLGAVIGVALAGSFAVLDALSALNFGVLLVLNVIINARDGLFDTAGEAALKEVVPDEAMGRAQAANQGRGAAIQLAGGPLGGALLAVGGWLVAVAAGVTYLVSVVTAWLLRRQELNARITTDGTTPDAASRRTPMLTEAREGIAWLLSRVDLRGVLWVSMIVNLGFNSAVTTIIYSLQQSGHSPLVIGALGSVLGAVMLAGAFVAPLLVPHIRGGVIVICSLIVATAGTAILPAIHSVPGIMAIIGVSVFLVPALNSALMGYFMVAVPTELLGRANSASRVLSMGAMPLAPLIAGFGLAFAGRTGTLVACAALTAVGVILALSNRALRSLPSEKEWGEHAQKFVAR
ncbi:MFS transporter [Paramicrobacterium agarici]|uniref:Putative MFS family arabinose efflux permease n=1 Tax=Paramicrobacterium agarici TaxID=630514 RepID=A0A2A9DY95_9MICO|nr:MFS transporter [Microbacterium agarici]PFG31564.1 putative MFS family arabinose efflux permease [Microbacterium agarici]